MLTTVRRAEDHLQYLCLSAQLPLQPVGGLAPSVGDYILHHDIYACINN
jgi:hypothetical protein